MFKKYFVLLSLVTSLQLSSGEKIIIDTDAGVDDAIAILTLLRYEDNKPRDSTFEIIGITCTYGNTKEENVETNVLKILTVAGRYNIPVFRGAKKPFLESFSTDNYFGLDGFGDASFDKNIFIKIDESKSSAIALVDLVNKNADNVSIISLGPLTNIALAIALDNDFIKKIKQFYIMGGSVSGIGNLRPNVEFNFAADPESNFVVFNSTRESKITLLPWETLLNSGLTKDWRFNVLGKYNSTYIEFINDIEKNLLKKYKSIWMSVDVMLAACAIEPALATSIETLNVYAVTEGQARGSVLVDYAKTTGRPLNTKIIHTIDQFLLKNILLKYLTCEEFSC